METTHGSYVQLRFVRKTPTAGTMVSCISQARSYFLTQRGDRQPGAKPTSEHSHGGLSRETAALLTRKTAPFGFSELLGRFSSSALFVKSATITIAYCYPPRAVPTHMTAHKRWGLR